MSNLDAIINKVGFEIVEAIKNQEKKTKYKNFIDKVLGVLANDGVYAYLVYCKANNIDDIFIEKLEKILNIINPIPKDNENKKDYEKYFQELSNKNLPNLLFLKELLEKALIYARYHAKAIKDD
ncbi:hypothetical protein [Caminibacter pacificus]